MENRTFKCPICKKDVELLNQHAIDGNNSEEYLSDLRLKNKKFHMKQHKIVRTYENRINLLEAKLRDLKWQYAYSKKIIGDK